MVVASQGKRWPGEAMDVPDMLPCTDQPAQQKNDPVPLVNGIMAEKTVLWKSVLFLL